MTRRLLFALAALAACVLAGCHHVAPYEREQLAKPGMDVQQREALRAQFYNHVYEAREAAMPTAEHAGGGCGCN
jgi:outer membrane murein-binding lipoprotein Lpp